TAESHDQPSLVARRPSAPPLMIRPWSGALPAKTSRGLPDLGQGEAVLGGDLGRALDEIVAHLVVGALLDLPLAEDLVVLRLRAAEELGQIGPVLVHRRLQARLAIRRLDQLGREVLAELRVKAFLRHGGARDVPERMERAVQ